MNIEESELKVHRESFKIKAKPIKTEMAVLMQAIRSGSEEITEDVYQISDMENEMMGYYNKDGILIFSRPLLPTERQFSITDSFKTGTHGK